MRLILAAALAAFTGSALADTTLEYVDETSGSPASKLLISKGRIRTEASGHAAIYDSATDTMTLLDHGRKTYTVFDAAAMQQLNAQMTAARAQLDAAMAGMTPEQRAQMQQAMGGRMPGAAPAATAAPVYTDTGRTAAFGGYDCKVVTYTAGGVGGELCVADEDEVDVPSEDVATVRKFAEYSQKMAAMAGAGKMQGFDFSAMQGVPVRIQAAGQPSQVVKAIGHGALAADTFAIPAGYTLQQLPRMGGR